MTLPSKIDAARAILLRDTMYVHLDSNVEGVRVPPHLQGKDQVVLHVGLDMPIPIPDLAITDKGISGTLSFRGIGHFCVVPWKAVFALVGTNGRGVVWSKDMPDSIADKLVKAADMSKVEDVRKSPKVTVPYLKRVK